MIAGNAVHKSKFAEKNRTSARSAQVHQKAELSFLIDIRAKMQAGKGAGYARWAKVFNLKQMAKAMMFMEEHGIKSYAELKEKADGISEKCDALLESVKADEARMSEVSVLRKHLINYAKQKIFSLRIRHPATIESSMKPIGIRWPYAAQRKRRLMPIRKRTVLTKSSRASAS